MLNIERPKVELEVQSTLPIRIRSTARPVV
jgi:hypothetical protein